MDGIAIIAIIIGGLIILYNIAIQFSNLLKIIEYTFATNSLINYWEYYFKGNFSIRALISSLIGMIIAIVLFFIIAPFVLYRKYVLKNDVDSQLETGLMFQYKEVYPNIDSGEIFKTNIDFLNIKDIYVSATGMLKLDLMSIIAEISKYCEANNIKFEFTVMEKVKLSTKEIATVPIMMTVNDRTYPMYLIYTREHQEKYDDIKKLLFQSGYKDCVYFSLDQNTISLNYSS